MKRVCFLILSSIILFIAFALINPVNVFSIKGDKTEIPVNLEVSGAEALCQTDDGYVWIAQYSGLVRYDSENFVTYSSFVQDGIEYSILNVRALAKKNNTLYIATSSDIFIHENEEFKALEYDFGIIRDIDFNDVNNTLYVSTSSSAFSYDTISGDVKKISVTDGANIAGIAIDKNNDGFFFRNDKGVFDKNGNIVISNSKILDIHVYDNILYAAGIDGIIFRYNITNKTHLDDIVIGDQINKVLYNESTKTLYAGTEKNGLYYVDLSTDVPVITVVDNLENKMQLIDLMIDYEGNLWIASHNNGASGVSIIAKNALVELLYDDPIWNELNDASKTVYAVERIGDTLYIVSANTILMYDTVEKKILSDNPIMDAVNEYTTLNSITTFGCRDVEEYKNKIYFAINNIGIVEFDPTTKAVVIYGLEYLKDHIDHVEDLSQKDPFNPDHIVFVRSLRSFDDYLAIGYSSGIMKFDLTSLDIIHINYSVLFINKTKDGKLLFDRSYGLFEVDDEFKKIEEIPTEKEVTGNRLKFLVDGDYIYYNLNSRLFRLEEHNGEYSSKEIKIPYVKGSIVELSKIEYTNENNETISKYLICSETQIFMTDSLNVDELTDYEFFDKTNGLQPIKANTSGYYDKNEQLYYIQSTSGIFVYDFKETKGVVVPVKVAVSSVVLDDKENYGSEINIDKDVYRVAFNLSILGFRPNKGYTVYYKLEGIDNEFHITDHDNKSIYYTNLPGGSYKFHAYAIDEFGQQSNEVIISLVKAKKIYEQVWFWVVLSMILLGLVIGATFTIIHIKTKQSLKKQLEYKNITVESIQAIARTIDAKDEYTNGHSIRVGYYSKLIAQNLGMKDDEVDNIYYIALLHDIGKIAIPDSILNKPGRLTDDEFKIMKSHTTRGAKILKGISTIPQIIEGAKSHHEKYDGSGYPEGLKGEEIPYVARIICCADCFDAMASKRVYKEPFPLEKIISEFERCSGTQFDPHISQVVVSMMKNGILKPYSGENTYLGEDGKTHRYTKNDSVEE